MSEIKMPTLILVGERDFVCSVKMANIMHQGIQGSHMAVLPNAGHMVHFEVPQEHARAIHEFVASLG
ncbi:alpha/beta hydrolase [Pendulispora brunnea]|uniref:Alpha/beta hydrolase n=1 Tax=Pendulispora brunnea TaxID=2905690 RepID=A0ABZ2K666_9BACT